MRALVGKEGGFLAPKWNSDVRSESKSGLGDEIEIPVLVTSKSEVDYLRKVVLTSVLILCRDQKWI